MVCPLLLYNYVRSKCSFSAEREGSHFSACGKRVVSMCSAVSDHMHTPLNFTTSIYIHYTAEYCKQVKEQSMQLGPEYEILTKAEILVFSELV